MQQCRIKLTTAENVAAFKHYRKLPNMLVFEAKIRIPLYLRRLYLNTGYKAHHDIIKA